MHARQEHDGNLVGGLMNHLRLIRRHATRFQVIDVLLDGALLGLDASAPSDQARRVSNIPPERDSFLVEPSKISSPAPRGGA